MTTHWNLDGYPGLAAAASGARSRPILYRDYWRKRDDATVVVVRTDGSEAMTHRMLTFGLTREHGRRAWRGSARAQIAAAARLRGQDQTRIATAVSEIARNAFRYAGGGKVEFSVEGETAPQVLDDRGSPTRARASPNLHDDPRRHAIARHRHGHRASSARDA